MSGAGGAHGGQRRGRPLLVRAGTVQARGVPRAAGARRVRRWGTVGSESAQGAAVAPSLGPAARKRPASCLHRPRGPAPGPRPQATWSAQARPCPAHRRGLRLRDASERTSARPPVLACDSRARARLSPPPHPPPPAIRLNVARARSGGSSDRYAERAGEGGGGPRGQRAGADARLGLAASPSLARCAQAREGPVAELPGHPELLAKSLYTHLSRLGGSPAQTVFQDFRQL